MKIRHPMTLRHPVLTPPPCPLNTALLWAHKNSLKIYRILIITHNARTNATLDLKECHRRVRLIELNVKRIVSLTFVKFY